MRNRFQTRGVALIITLAMIAMLTFLIVAYFSRSLVNVQIESASTSSSRAEVLARTAAEIVVSDFKAEIIAGSVASGTVSQARIYSPRTRAAAVPAVTRSTAITGASNTAIFMNLVKQSTDRFFPASDPYLSANPTIQSVTEWTTDIVSANGRSVINKRWDNPDQLMPLGPLLLASPPPPALAPSYCRFYANNMLPHWVMMTRKGVPAVQAWTADWKDYSPANPKAAIGRFAYNVYDVGGLLDINVAGYPETSPSTLPDTILGQKGTLGLAQLSAIPGMGASLPEAAANAALFTKTWRNLASGTSANNYLAYLGFSKNGTTDLSGNSFFLAGPKSGFLSAANGSTLADNHVLGRQDLIRLGIKTNNASVGAASVYGLSFSALPNLTHFTRELNAPSWAPALNASDSALGGVDNPANVSFAPYAYATNKDNFRAANRFFPNVRVAPGSSWRRLTGESAIAGEPLVKYRFPLSWLAVLQDADPSTPTWDLTPEAKAIVNALDLRSKANGNPAGLNGTNINDKAAWFVQCAFGLKWNTTPDPVTLKPANRWDYTGSPNDAFTPNSVTTTIKLLGDPNGTGTAVTKDNREPNFFELLKAGILSGSLGNSSDFESLCSSIGEDSNPDNQIMQIGANIIDQADSDSYPTLIGFGYEMDIPTDSSNKPNLNSPLSPLNTSKSTGEVKVFAGVEDIPYIYTFLSTPYRIPTGDKNLRPDSDPTSPTQTQNTQRDTIDAWLQFVMWKPQQPAVSTATPSSFRIAFTGSDIHLTIPGDTTNPVTFPVTPPDVPPIIYGDRSTLPVLSAPPASAPVTISFNDMPGYFRAPTVLGGMSPTTDHGFVCSQPEGNGSNPRSGGQLPRGMWLGETYRPEKVAVPSTSPYTNAPKTQHTEFRCVPDCKIELQYRDGAGTWRTYQRYDRFGIGTGQNVRNRGLFGYSDSPLLLNQAGSPVLPNDNGAVSGSPAYRALDIATIAMGAVDPRSQRYGLLALYLDVSATKAPTMLPPTGVVYPDNWKYYLKQGWAPTSGQPYNMSFNPSYTANARFSPNWSGGAQQNPWDHHENYSPITEPTKFFADNVLSTTNYYRDPDGVTRRADGDSANGVRPMQLTDANTPNTQDLGRVINRPFRSVGELAYVFRDEPYKSLNLFTDKSADSALLDLFSVNEQPAVIAGKVNLNTQNAAVLQAVIAGAAREELSTTNTISLADALTIAKNLISTTTATTGTNTGPLLNPAEIASRLANMVAPASGPGTPDQAIKTRREVVARALAGSGQTRTWNFLIDVIAQSGRYGPNASASSQFIVEGEKRYWLHVAIDRYTGQVIDQQLESVME